MNGELADALVLARDPERLLLDLPPDLVEVRVALVYVQELAPLGVVGWCLGDGGVDELEDEWSAGDDALATGEEVASDDAAWGFRTGEGAAEWRVRTFLGHWTSPLTGFQPNPTLNIMDIRPTSSSTNHSELGHVQLSA